MIVIATPPNAEKIVELLLSRGTDVQIAHLVALGEDRFVEKAFRATMELFATTGGVCLPTENDCRQAFRILRAMKVV